MEMNIVLRERQRRPRTYLVYLNNIGISKKDKIGTLQEYRERVKNSRKLFDIGWLISFSFVFFPYNCINEINHDHDKKYKMFGFSFV